MSQRWSTKERTRFVRRWFWSDNILPCLTIGGLDNILRTPSIILKHKAVVVLPKAPRYHPKYASPINSTQSKKVIILEVIYHQLMNGPRVKMRSPFDWKNFIPDSSSPWAISNHMQQILKLVTTKLTGAITFHTPSNLSTFVSTRCLKTSKWRFELVVVLETSKRVSKRPLLNSMFPPLAFHMRFSNRKSPSQNPLKWSYRVRQKGVVVVFLQSLQWYHHNNKGERNQCSKNHHLWPSRLGDNSCLSSKQRGYVF